MEKSRHPILYLSWLLFPLSLYATEEMACRTTGMAFPVEVFNTDSCPADLGELQTMDLGPMISYYPMDHNINDYTGHGLNGTLSGPYRSSGSCNVLDSCYQFDGLPDYISLPNAALYTSSAKTVSFWFRKNNDSIMITPGPMVECEGLVFKNNNTGPGVQFNMSLLGQYPPFSLYVQSGNGSTLTNVISPPMIQPHIWYHATGIFTPAKMILYCDGVFIDSVLISGNITNSFPILLGKIPNNGESTRHLVGNLDDLRIYDRELNPCEVKFLASACLEPKMLSLELMQDSVCEGNTVCVNLINPEYNVIYQLLNSQTLLPAGPAILSSCESVLCLSTGPINTTQSLVVRAVHNQSGCSILLDTTVTIYLKPPVYNISSYSLCPGDSVFALGQYLHLPGIYSDTIDIGESCDSILIVNITQIPQITADLGADTIICPYQTLILDPGSGFTSYNWNTGAQSNTLNVSQSNLYSVTVTYGNGCTSYDSIDVHVVPQPVINLGNDTIVCIGLSVTLNPGTGFNTFLWSTGDTNSTISISNSGIYSVTVTYNNFCQGDDTVIIDFQPGNMISLGPDTAICQGNTVILSPGPGFATYNWNNGVTTPSLTIDTAGIFNVSITRSDGCYDADTVQVIVHPSPVVIFDTTVCDGQSIFAGGTWQSLPGTYTDSWLTSFGCDSIKVTILTVSPVFVLNQSSQICEGDSIFLSGNYQHQSGTYYDSLSTLSGCDSIIINQLSVNPNPPGILPNDTSSCEDVSLFLNAGNSNNSYIWNTGDLTPVILVTLSGMYTVSITNPFNCSLLDSCQVIIYVLPQMNVSPDATILCRDSSVTVYASGAYSYFWSPAAGLSSTTDSIVIANPTVTTIFTLIGTSINGCSDTTQLEITVVDPPVSTLDSSNLICGGESLELNAGNCTDCLYHWNSGSNSPQITVQYAGTYIVTITNTGCSITDTAEIIPCPDFIIPNVFTPNGDDYNETFYVKAAEFLKYRMIVFNRWGLVVFESEDALEHWDGTCKGSRCSEGVYFYSLFYEVKASGGTVNSGNTEGTVTLLR